jgi:hypothetical protein
VRCFHTIEDVGYVLCETKSSLHGIDSAAEEEYQTIMQAIDAGDKKTGRKIGEMRKAGRLKELQHEQPRLAFLCDTTVQVFGQCAACKAGEPCTFGGQDLFTCACPPAAEMAAQVQLLFQCSTIVVECSFVAWDMDEEEAEHQASSRGHIAWSQLRPIVESHPDIEFILVHFSLRYSDEELRRFFSTASSNGTYVPNVLLWLDEGLSRSPGAAL